MALLGDEKVKMMLADPRIKLFSGALKCINQNITVEKSLGCAEAVNFIHNSVWGHPIGGYQSTIGLFMALKNDKTFIEVKTPMAGDIVINATSGKNIGHTGYVMANNQIASNSSLNGRFIYNYNLVSWDEYFKIKKGLATHYFRKISP